MGLDRVDRPASFPAGAGRRENRAGDGGGGVEAASLVLCFIRGDDRFGKGLRSLLRQVVADAAVDEPVLVSP